jgi:hypothetical protein
VEVLDPGHPDRPALLSHLESLIRAHHELYEEGRVKAEQWEELLSRALRMAGHPNEWNCGSHAVGTDITLDSGSTVSAKSGVYDEAKRILTFSGSRLGKHGADIASMVHHVNASRSDYYAFAASPKRKPGLCYDIFFVPGALIHYGSREDWTLKPDAKSPVWAYSGPRLRAEIRSSMSHQIWTDLRLERMSQVPAHSFSI